jgi:hypothetical protein
VREARIVGEVDSRPKHCKELTRPVAMGIFGTGQEAGQEQNKTPFSIRHFPFLIFHFPLANPYYPPWIEGWPTIRAIKL